MHGLLKSHNTLNYDYLSRQAIPDTATFATGVFKDFQLTLYTERQRVLGHLWADL